MATHTSNVTLSGFSILILTLSLNLAMSGCSAPPPGPSGHAPVSLSLQPNNVVLEATKTQQFTASVINTSDKGVIWEIAGCSSADCGTISADGLYTAPFVVADTGTLNITATPHADPTRTKTVRVTLLPLSVIIPQDSVTLCAREEHQFSASIMRHPNTAVTWSLSGCTAPDCGSIDAGGLYSSPSLVPSRSEVTVTARSQADPSKYDSVTVYNMPIEVSVAPPRMILSAGASVDFVANVKQDILNAGVTWALEPGCSPETCGTLSNRTATSATYTAPEIDPGLSMIKLIATSVADTDKTIEVLITISGTLTLLKEGDYAFYFNGDRGYDEETYAVWLAGAGRFHCDGQGNITGGVEDLNFPSGVLQSVPFTGTYAVAPDYRGFLEIDTSGGTSRYLMTVDPAGTGGRFISMEDSSEDSSVSVAGYFELQDESAFSISGIAGSYAIGISSGGREMAAVGRFDIDGKGHISGGRMDFTGYVYSGGYFIPSNTLGVSLTGLISEPDPNTGRGTALISLTPATLEGTENFGFAYYIISEQKILLAQTDDLTSYPTVMSGEMRRQNGPFSVSSFSAPVIFSLSGLSIYETGATIGRIVPDEEGSVTGTIDLFDFLGGFEFPAIRNEDFRGSYSIGSDGRSEIALEMDLDFEPYNRSQDPEAFYLRNANQTYVAYFFAQNQGFLMQTSGNRGSGPSLGVFRPQAVGPFSAGLISGTFWTGTTPGLSISCAKRSAGLATFDSTGAITSSMDANNSCSGVSHGEFTGRYTVNGNGRGTIVPDGSADPEMIFWIISPSELVGVSGRYWERALIEYRR